MGTMKIVVPFVSFLFLLLTGCSSPVEQNVPSARLEAAQPEPPTPSLWPEVPCVLWEVQVDSHLDPANPSNWVDPINLALGEWDRALQGTFNAHIVLTDRPQPYSDPKGCVLAIAADPNLESEEDGAVGYTDPTLQNDVTGQKFGHIRIVPHVCTFVGCEALIIHELGHFFGLAHSPQVGSVMHLPLQVPACISDDDAMNACKLWGLCGDPGLHADRCKSTAIVGRVGS